MADTKSKEQELAERPAAMPQESAPAGNESQPKKKRNPVLIGVIAVIAVLAVIFGIRFYLYNRVHVSTDDAYVTGDLVDVSPQINGSLMDLNVQQGDLVRKGQLIARLDPSGPESSYRQAQANFQAALSQIPAASRNLAYQQKSLDAGVKKARAALAAQQAKSAGAQKLVTLTSDTYKNQIAQAHAQVDAADAQWQQSQAQVRSAQANQDNYVQAVQTANDALANAQQGVQTAEQGAHAANAKVVAFQAQADKSSRDLSRYQTLYDQDAISPQQFDAARSQRDADAAQLESAKAQALQAASQVESARRVVDQSRSQVAQAKKSVAQAAAQTAAAQKASAASHEQVNVARAGLGLAQAGVNQIGIQQENLASTNSSTGENEADLATAQAGQEQVEVRRAQVRTYRDQAAQARAALINAKINLGDTYIYAPCDGEVVRKDSNVGATLSPGTTLVTLTRGGYVWVEANFKETQLQDVRVGQPAEVEVDALHGKIFKGRVRSITEATGASTALLPPDNATGNFTKVVQRVPVRIELEPAAAGDDANYATADDIKHLRQGLSVTATIDTSNKDDSQAPQAQGSGASVQPSAGQNEPGGATGSMVQPAQTSGGPASSTTTGTMDSDIAPEHLPAQAPGSDGEPPTNETGNPPSQVPPTPGNGTAGTGGAPATTATTGGPAGTTGAPSASTTTGTAGTTGAAGAPGGSPGGAPSAGGQAVGASPGAGTGSAGGGGSAGGH